MFPLGWNRWWAACLWLLVFPEPIRFEGWGYQQAYHRASRFSLSCYLPPSSLIVSSSASSSSSSSSSSSTNLIFLQLGLDKDLQLYLSSAIGLDPGWRGTRYLAYFLFVSFSQPVWPFGRVSVNNNQQGWWHWSVELSFWSFCFQQLFNARLIHNHHLSALQRTFCLHHLLRLHSHPHHRHHHRCNVSTIFGNQIIILFSFWSSSSFSPSSSIIFLASFLDIQQYQLWAHGYSSWWLISLGPEMRLITFAFPRVRHGVALSSTVTPSGSEELYKTESAPTPFNADILLLFLTHTFLLYVQSLSYHLGNVSLFFRSLLSSCFGFLAVVSLFFIFAVILFRFSAEVLKLMM